MSNKIDEKNGTAADEDMEFVLLCQKGNGDAFEVLVERHQKKMFNIAYRITGDYEDAGEVTQEAFFSAFKAINKFRGEAKFSTWLTGITINHAKNRIKQKASRSRFEVEPVDDPVSHEIPVIERLEQKEVQKKIQECINSLDGEYREVLVLRDIEGFSYEEIHDILKIPDGTVKSRLFRARDALKNCLEKVLGDT